VSYICATWTTDYPGKVHVWFITEKPQYLLAFALQNIGVKPLTDDGVVEEQNEKSDSKIHIMV
jgi:hypothetical protein